ncbi:peptide ABC transporter substrate-binding protein [Brevibacillus choshinensis]|uniref:peptide ABC transporter substrate-binding protein n=1 Tax=Brevibacillus choshinensis TaxID=54911 RepID=UPI002E1B6DCE|nr:peptide ABC transporter substrate-binding protein [Brevibacillus choshinensis]MED4781465.1 peptide ABC transporter substrate-binding protein [Brevibacillus choshinensis]
MKKRVSAFLVSCLLVAGALAGCSTASSPAAKPPTSNESQSSNNSAPATGTTDGGTKVFRLNISSEPSTADPGLADDNISSMVVSSTFDGMTRKGPDGKFHEAAAEKIEISEDGLTYTFHLRDAKWSNGDPVTAQDFEYAWKRALDPQTASDYAYQLFYLKKGADFNAGKATKDDVGVKALDDKTLEVHLENPTPFFLELTAFATYYPVNKKVAAANPKWAMEANTHVGNGPFKLETWAHKNKMSFVKNDSYWDKDNVKVDKIEVTMIEDQNTELSMFENDELDWAGGPFSTLPTDAIPALKDSGKFKVIPVANTYWYQFNIEKPPFNNAKIRKAFGYAIDRQAIIDNILQAGQIPATGLLPPTMAVKPDGYFRDHDTALAKQLLAEGMQELGITKLPPLTLIFNTSEAHKKIAEAVQDQWKQTLGVDVKVANMEFKVYLDTLDSGNYQIARRGWVADFNDPVNFIEIFREKRGNNNTNWTNDKYNELLQQAAKERDLEKRKQLFGQAEQILMDEMPVAPIYFYTVSWLEGEKVAKGIYTDALGNGDLKYVEMK